MSTSCRPTRPCKGSERATEGAATVTLTRVPTAEGSPLPDAVRDGAHARRRLPPRRGEEVVVPLRGSDHVPLPSRLRRVSPGRRRVECRAATAARADPAGEVVGSRGNGFSANSSSGSTRMARSRGASTASPSPGCTRPGSGRSPSPGSWTRTTRPASRRGTAPPPDPGATPRNTSPAVQVDRRAVWGRGHRVQLGGWQKSAATERAFRFVAHPRRAVRFEPGRARGEQLAGLTETRGASSSGCGRTSRRSRSSTCRTSGSGTRPPGLGRPHEPPPLSLTTPP